MFDIISIGDTVVDTLIPLTVAKVEYILSFEPFSIT